MHHSMDKNPNKNYVCPPDADPAWRAAYEAGVDMVQLEKTFL